MFRRRYRDPFAGLDRLTGLARDIHPRGRWRHAAFHPRRRRARVPSWALIVLAGLAGLALAKLMSAATGRDQPAAQKAVVGALLVLVGTLVLSLRRRAVHYRW